MVWGPYLARRNDINRMSLDGCVHPFFSCFESHFNKELNTTGLLEKVFVTLLLFIFKVKHPFYCDIFFPTVRWVTQTLLLQPLCQIVEAIVGPTSQKVCPPPALRLDWIVKTEQRGPSCVQMTKNYTKLSELSE